MKSGMTRWNSVPSYSGERFRWLSRGSTHSFSPVARPTKLATVFGASLLKSFTTIGPLLVLMVAQRSLPASALLIHGPPEASGTSVGGGGAGGGFWAAGAGGFG